MGGEGAKGEQALFPLKKKVHFALMWRLQCERARLERGSEEEKRNKENS